MVTRDAYNHNIPSGGNPYEMPTYKFLCEQAVIQYDQMIKIGICPEQARMVLPQSMMTEWYWSGTLMAFARVCNLRCKPDTQKETREIANQIDELTGDLFPVSWEALRK